MVMVWQQIEIWLKQELLNWKVGQKELFRIQRETKQWKKKTKEWVIDIEDRMKTTNIYLIIEVLEGEERKEWGRDSIWREWKFSELLKDIHLHIWKISIQFQVE